jgi:hypothetical protein
MSAAEDVYAGLEANDSADACDFLAAITRHEFEELTDAWPESEARHPG